MTRSSLRSTHYVIQPPATLDKYEAKALKNGRERSLPQCSTSSGPDRSPPGCAGPVPEPGHGRLRRDWQDGTRVRTGMRTLEWKGKVEPDIQPDMTRDASAQSIGEGRWQSRRRYARHAVAAGGGSTLRQAHVTQGDEACRRTMVCGRIQVHRGDKGRMIRMVGLRALAEGLERADADLRCHW